MTDVNKLNMPGTQKAVLQMCPSGRVWVHVPEVDGLKQQSRSWYTAGTCRSAKRQSLHEMKARPAFMIYLVSLNFKSVFL